MPTKKKTKTEQTKPAPKQLASDDWALRKTMTERLQISDRTLRRMEKQLALRVLPDTKGRMRMHPDDVERLAKTAAGESSATAPTPAANEADKKAPAVATVPAQDLSNDGVTAARVSKLFSEGKSRRAVVELLELAPTLVQRLYRVWIELGGGLVLDDRTLDRLADAGLNVDTLDGFIGSLATLLRDSRALEALRVACACGCGQTMQLSSEMLVSAIAKGAFDDWHLSTHADALRRRREVERARRQGE